jgi:hypothetical protein
VLHKERHHVGLTLRGHLESLICLMVGEAGRGGLSEELLPAERGNLGGRLDA